MKLRVYAFAYFTKYGSHVSCASTCALPLASAQSHFPATRRAHRQSLSEPASQACRKEEDLVRYATAVLDALGWKWGPAHLELISTTDGPRLVEARERSPSDETLQRTCTAR